MASKAQVAQWKATKPEVYVRYLESKRLAARKKRRTQGYMERRTRRVQKRVGERRLDALALMGGRCVRCGFDDHRALQIDHVNGDGGAYRARTVPYYNKIIRSFLAGEGRFQLLCANCNWIKRYERGETGGATPIRLVNPLTVQPDLLETFTPAREA